MSGERDLLNLPPKTHLSPEVAASDFDSSGGAGGGNVNWPIVMYMGLVVAAPYLMWKLVASVAGLEGEGGEDGDRESAKSENEASRGITQPILSLIYSVSVVRVRVLVAATLASILGPRMDERRRRALCGHGRVRLRLGGRLRDLLPGR